MIAEAIEKVRQTPFNQQNRGQAARFVKINDEWGLKFYLDEDNRDKCYKLQQKAFDNYIGPKLGDKVDFTMGDFFYYGFITEVATVPVDEFCKEYNIKPFDIYEDGMYMDEYDEMEDDLKDKKEYRDLMVKMIEVKLGTMDMHPGNVGYLSDGRLVCIDFDNC